MGNKESSLQDRQPNQFQEGDRVKVELLAEILEQMQQGHGGFVESMKEIIGVVGSVKEIDADGDVVVIFSNAKRFCFNPAVLTMVSLCNGPRVTAPQSLFSPGDVVRVVVNESELKKLQEGFGGWVDTMAKVVNRVGIIKRIVASKVVRIHFGGVTWNFNPRAVKKVQQPELDKMKLSFGVKQNFKKGDIIQISSDREFVKSRQNGHGDWVDDMNVILGQCGHIKSVYQDGDLRIKIKTKIWTMNPLAVDKLVTGFDVVDMTQLLTLLAGALNTTDDSGDRNSITLFMAAKSGDTGLVQASLEKPGVDINHTVSGVTALQTASNKGHIDIVRMLLDRDADVKLVDGDGDTALHFAVHGNRMDVLRLLLARGAPINTKNSKQLSPLHLAVIGDRRDIIELLLVEGADRNTQDGEGDTPVHDAIYKTSNEILELLLDKGASVTIPNKKGFTALHHAALRDNNEAIKLILRYHPDIANMPKEDGFTALHLAVINNHLDIIDSLIQVGSANTNCINSNGQTPLHISAVRTHADAAKRLLSGAADRINIGAKDNDGDTALHEACRRSSPDIAELLMRMHPLLRGLAGQPPDPNAAKEIAILLVENGADLRIKNNDGKTALDVCSDDDFKISLSQAASNRTMRQIAGTSSGSPSASATPPAARTHAPQPSRSVSKETSRDRSGSNKHDDQVDQQPENKFLSMDYKRGYTDLTTEMEDLKSKTACQICFDNPRNMVYQCGHMFCEECSSHVATCPTCREPIMQRIKVFG